MSLHVMQLKNEIGILFRLPYISFDTILEEFNGSSEILSYAITTCYPPQSAVNRACFVQVKAPF